MLRFRIVVILFWALLWCVSLSLPVAILGPNPDDSWRGMLVLMWGWIGIFDLQFGWLANLTIWGIAVLLLVKDAPVVLRTSAAVFQIGLAINALFWDTVVASTGASVLSIDRFGAGYYVWQSLMVGSAGILLLVTVVDAKDRKTASSARSVGALTHRGRSSGTWP